MGIKEKLTAELKNVKLGKYETLLSPMCLTRSAFLQSRTANLHRL